MVEQMEIKKQKQETQISAADSWALAINSNLDKINDALPKDFNKARFVQNAMSMINDKPELVQDAKTRDQVLPVLMRGAVLGLDYTSKEWYPVKYGAKLEFQMSYRGAEKLARKYSIKPIKSINYDVVRDGDDFQMEIKDNDVKINFKPKPFNRADIVGVFCLVTFTDGSAVADTMNIDEINATRKKSKMGNGGAWSEFFSEMAKKCVIKRLMKRIEIDFETPEQAVYYNDDEAIATEPEDVIDSVAVEIKENANQIPFNPED